MILGSLDGRSALLLVVFTASGAIPVAAASWVWTRVRATRSLRTQLALVALAPMLATWCGAALAAQQMFISDQDLGALAVIAATASLVGPLIALQLSRQISSDADRLVHLSRAIGSGDRPRDAPAVRLDELRRLGDELVAMSAELERARAHERSLEQSRRDLVTAISHDLRSPLASIRAMAESIQDGVVTDEAEVAAYLCSVISETEHLTRLVEDLLELSQITSGAIDPSGPTAGLDDLVGSIVVAAALVGQQRDVAVDSTLAAGDVPVLQTPVGRAVRNVVDNAVRHTPPAGRVVVETAVDGHDLVVRVSDGCGGIPEDDLPRIFDVAFRGDQSRRRDGAGGGLGLPITNGLLGSIGGSVEVRNADRGCTFELRVPSAAQAGQLCRRHDPASPTAAT